jgi:hypothetical protein
VKGDEKVERELCLEKKVECQTINITDSRLAFRSLVSTRLAYFDKSTLQNDDRLNLGSILLQLASRSLP